MPHGRRHRPRKLTDQGPAPRFDDARSPHASALTARDLELLRYVTRHGLCTGEQLGRRFFSGSTATWRRLRILERLNLIHRQRTWWKGPRVVLATVVGARLADVDLPVAHLNLPELQHTLAVVDLSEELLGKYRGSSWVTERELRRDALRDLRKRDMEPRALSLRTADGVLIMSGKRIAIELDLTNKRTEVYEQLLKHYASQHGINQVWWFFRSSDAGRRLVTIAGRFEMGDFIKVRPWLGPAHGSLLEAV